MKRLDWFKFNPMDWLAGSIQLLSDAEKGTYIDLCALIWKAGGELENNKLLHRKLRLDYATACDRINSYCDLEILAMRDDILSVKFLSEQLKEIESTANKNAENARKRWENKDSSMRRDANKNKKEIKNKNKKEIKNKNKKEDSRKEKEEKIDNKKQVFDRFRVLYPGSKRGLDIEFDNFKKKNKDWRTVVMDLEELLKLQITKRGAAKAAGAFVPQWKNLSTYINQKCWSMEENFEVPQQVNITPQQQSPHDQTLNEWILCSKPTNAQIEAIKSILAKDQLIAPQALYDAFKREKRNEAYPDLFKVVEKLKKTHKPMSEAERKQKEEFEAMMKRDMEDLYPSQEVPK